jgi:hypothetical protein
MTRVAVALVLPLLALACGTDPQPAATTTSAESSSGSVSTSAGTTTMTTIDPDTSTPTSVDASSGSSGSSTGSGFKLDVGGVIDVPPSDTEAEEGCTKVDVIISIDHSDSMYEEIDAMIGPVFDSFPDALLAVNNGLDDFHLGVMDACNNPAILHNWGIDGFCDFSTNKNYMSSTSPNLIDEYHCVTDLAFNGYNNTPDFCTMNNDDEAPANTAADAVNPPFADEQNDGFLRNDAVLFVVAMTDEDEQPVPIQTPQQIVDKIVEAKGTIDNVVFLGIAGGSNCNGPYGSAQNATTMKAVTQIFVDEGQGLFWDLCAGNLEMAFDQVLEQIDSTCQAFQPPN